MRTLTYAISVLLLTSCAHIPRPPEITVTPVEVVEVYKPVVQRCIDRMPDLPTLAEVPTVGIDQQTLARIRREQALVLHVNEMRVMMTPCLKETK